MDPLGIETEPGTCVFDAATKTAAVEALRGVGLTWDELTDTQQRRVTAALSESGTPQRLAADLPRY